MIKMDIVVLLNSRFIEITEVYNIYIDGESNFDYSIDYVRHELMHDMQEHIKEGNFMKRIKQKEKN